MDQDKIFKNKAYPSLNFADSDGVAIRNPHGKRKTAIRIALSGGDQCGINSNVAGKGIDGNQAFENTICRRRHVVKAKSKIYWCNQDLNITSEFDRLLLTKKNYC